MESMQQLAERIVAVLASMAARRKQSLGKFRWLLVSLIVWATATAGGYAQAWKYHPKKSWEHHPKKSWEYHPKKSWEYHPKKSWKYHSKESWKYHPKQKQQLRVTRDTGKNDYRITCTHPLVAELVAQVTGDRAQVESFDIDFGRLHAGFVPYPLRADMVFLTGLDEHGRPEAVPERVVGSKPVYAIAKDVDPAQLIELPGVAGGHDPHIWLDIAIWRKFLEAITRQVSEFDASHAGYYLANYERHAQELDQLDSWARQVLSTVPSDRRVLVTDSLGLEYLVRRYGFDVRTFTDLQAEHEGPDKIVAFLAERNIHTIFSLKPASAEWSRALVDRAGTAGHVLEIGEPLLLEAAAAPGSYQDSYHGMIVQDVSTIARALGGTVP